VAALPGAKPKFAFPRGREKQATLVEAPAAEHAPRFQALDEAKSVLGVDADLVFRPARNGRLSEPPDHPARGANASRALWSFKDRGSKNGPGLQARPCRPGPVVPARKAR
jgi:hypothetical protein